MCYNGCRFESFNPMTGDCKCRLPRGQECPEEEREVMCPYCEEEFTVRDVDDCCECPDCGLTVKL